MQLKIGSLISFYPKSFARDLTDCDWIVVGMAQVKDEDVITLHEANNGSSRFMEGGSTRLLPAESVYCGLFNGTVKIIGHGDSDSWPPSNSPTGLSEGGSGAEVVQ